jgi:hypothetical protein
MHAVTLHSQSDRTSLANGVDAGGTELAQSSEESVAGNVHAQQSGWAKLIESAAQASGEVHTELARLEMEWRKSLQRPMRRKLLGRMCSHITSIMAAAANARAIAAIEQSTREEVAVKLELTALALSKVSHLKNMSTPTLWEVKNLLRTSCLEILDDAELHARLQEEHLPTANEGARRRRGSLIDANQLINGIDPACGKFKQPHLRHQAVVALRRLYQEHDDCGRYERALAEQRGVCLKRISAVMLFLILGISAALVMYGIETDDQKSIELLRRIAALFVVLCAGTLGSLLALLLKFRDVFRRIYEMTAHWAVLPAQATVGATLALILFLMYRAGFVELQGWPSLRVELVQLAVFSLVAGFSEPFVLNIIQRIEKMVNQ